MQALEHIVGIMVRLGILDQVQGDKGRAFVCANKYTIGKPFARAGKVAGSDEGQEEEEEAIGDYEQDRHANIARNAAFLASLGL